MYAKHQFLSHFLLILKPTLFFGCVPFTWNRKSKQIESSLTSNYHKNMYKLKCNLHVFFTTTIVLQVILSKDQDPATKAMCTFTVAMLTLTTVVVKEYSLKHREATSLMQRFILSSKEIKDPMDPYEKNRKLAIDLLNPGTFLFPLLYTLGVAWMSPCMSSNFGFWMLQECSRYPMNPVLAIGIKLMMAGVNFWIWSFGMHATVLVGSGVVMIGAMHFRCRLKDYRKKIRTIKSDGSKYAYQYILIYRQIQILARQYNQLHQRGIVIAIIIAVVSTQSICIYALVEFGEMYVINQLFFAMMAVDCFMAIIMLCGTLADAFDISRKIKKEVLRIHKGSKWLYRFHISCQEIKMRFGMTNFMEKMTPLNFENFSLCQTVNMLLVEK